MTDKAGETTASTLTRLQLAKATALQQQGLLQEARILCEDILQECPDHFDGLHLMGLIALQGGDYQQAARLISKAIDIHPHNPAFFYHLGVALQELEELDGAMTGYDLATAMKPDFAEAWYNWGNALQERKRFAEAVVCYDKTLIIRGDFTEAHYNRAAALKGLGKYEESLAGYDQAIALNPDYEEAWLGRGNVLAELKRPHDAIADYNHALSLRPDYAEAHLGRGIVFHYLGQREMALGDYDQAITLKPDYAEAYLGRSSVLQESERFTEARISYNRAIAINPHLAKTCNNHGIAFHSLGQMDTAPASYDQTLALKQELQILDDAMVSDDRPFASKLETAPEKNGLNENLIKVDLCCGTSKPDGFIGVDRFPGNKVDIVADLTERFPFEDNSVDVVRACNAIEHLPDRIHTMNEIWRICKPNAKVDILVPSTDGRGAFQDPTHVSYWNINSFLYYSVGHPNHELCKRYGFRGGFKIENLYDFSGLDNIVYTQAILRAIK